MSPAAAGWWVYLLRCADGRLYCGICTDPARRLRQHNGELAGGARATRARRPVVLVYREAAATRSAALRREAAIKKLPRSAKLVLVGKPRRRTTVLC